MVANATINILKSESSVLLLENETSVRYQCEGELVHYNGSIEAHCRPTNDNKPEWIFSQGEPLCTGKILALIIGVQSILKNYL